MTLNDELTLFYKRSGFGDTLGTRPCTVLVYTGCMLVPLPNIETRRRFLKYHDLHHLITGYSVGRIGEGEISAWELGTGSAFISPTLGVMNLIALSTGLVLEPRRMWRAYRRGCASRNLYPAEHRAAVDAGEWKDIASLRKDLLEVKRADTHVILRCVEFGFYSVAAVIIHAIIAIPAVIARFITDLLLGYTMFEAVKPKRRTDLY